MQLFLIIVLRGTLLKKNTTIQHCMYYITHISHCLLHKNVSAENKTKQIHKKQNKNYQQNSILNTTGDTASKYTNTIHLIDSCEMFCKAVYFPLLFVVKLLRAMVTFERFLFATFYPKMPP